MVTKRTNAFIQKNKINTKYKTKKDFQIDPVTKIDIESENIIRNNIQKIFPKHNIIGEEKR